MIAVASAAAVLLLGFLPLANWIGGGERADWLADVVPYWVTGSVIVLGCAVLLAMFSERTSMLWRDGVYARLADRCAESPLLFAAALAAAALALYVAIAYAVFDLRPLLIDEVVQLRQARIFAAGRLWLPAEPYPEFFRSLHMVTADGKVYSQFPPGGPAMLALGELVRAPWLVGPLCGAAAAAAFAAFLRVAEPRRTVAVGAAALLVVTPFMAFMAGTYMNHVPALMWLLVAAASLAHVVSSPAPRPGLALVSGLGFGIAATIRPSDALAFALPAGVWYLARALKDRTRWADALAALAGIAAPVLLLMWFHVQTTGAPLRFAYEVLWGKEVGLGFHVAPFGVAHTPARGVELLNVYFLRLQRFLYDSPLPSLVPVAVALLLARRVGPLDRYLLASGGLLAGFYLAYWHDGLYLGPRFLYPLVPLLVLWTARMPALVRERLGAGLPYRVAVYGLAVAGLMALTMSAPVRVRQYGAGFALERWDPDAAARAAGVQDALVLVRESWESQMVVRMWALGISSADAERIYRYVDACRLEHALLALERGALRGPMAAAALQPLLRDSARVIVSQRPSGVNVRGVPGAPFTARCVQRLAETDAGVVALAPLLLAGRAGNNVFARDLHERDTLLLRQFPDRPVYLLQPTGDTAAAPVRFHPVPRDSLERAWGLRRSGGR